MLRRACSLTSSLTTRGDRGRLFDTNVGRLGRQLDRLTYHLRNGLKFSGGAPVASVLIASVERWASASFSAQLMDAADRFQVVDPRLR